METAKLKESTWTRLLQSQHIDQRFCLRNSDGEIEWPVVGDRTFVKD
jgi:hypothetical protein